MKVSETLLLSLVEPLHQGIYLRDSIALNLYESFAFLDVMSSSGTERLFQKSAQLLQYRLVRGKLAEHGDGLTATSLPFEPYRGIEILRPGLVAACATANRALTTAAPLLDRTIRRIHQHIT